jgi:hypothetical protein
LGTSSVSQAFTTCTTDPLVLTMTNSVLVLSQDIGTMAERILETQDKIGQMADRIVITEELMATTLLQLNQGGALAGSRAGVLLLSPATGDSVSRNAAPALSLSDNAGSYVLYVSESNDFSGAHVLPLLVTPQTPLYSVWQQAVQGISGSTLYIAVRTVDGNNNLSEISNVARLTLY